MASPQKENGYTAIANEIIEALYSQDLTMREIKIALLIIRYSYGFHQKTADLSASFIAAGIRIDVRDCQRALASLQAKKIIVRDGTKTSFQKDYEKWGRVGKSPTRAPGELPGGGPGELPGATPGYFTHPIKKTIKKYIPSPIGDDLSLKEKRMKKNRIGSYNESTMSDSYETVVDLETGEMQEDKKPAIKKKMDELIKWAENHRGFKFVNYPKQRSALKKMREAGISPRQIRDRWIQMALDEYWKDKGFDFMNVCTSFDRKV